jgi:RNA polymerase sigma factor (sigma-70 family)
MAEISDTGREGDPRMASTPASVASVNAWFVHEVLPLEATLLYFLRRSWRNKDDVEDFCHDVYVRVYEAALREIPRPAKPFVFTVARNLLINRARHQNVVAIEAVTDLEALGVALDEPGPDRIAMARQDLYRLQTALDRLPPRYREVVVMRKIEGLSRPEIAARMGIVESTVSEYLADGMAILTDTVLGEPSDPRGRP